MALEFLGEMADSGAEVENIQVNWEHLVVPARKDVLNKTKQNKTTKPTTILVVCQRAKAATT